MPKKRLEQGGRAGASRAGAALASLRLRSEPGDGATRARLQIAALEAAGEGGYRKLTVQSILDRGGVSRTRFYREFADKADCYADGYGAAIEALSDDLLAAARGGRDWLGGFSAALAALERFATSEPVLAKGTLAEVHVAGGAAGAKRNEVFERLSRAIDLARRDTSVSRHSPPPITASFILNAIEAAVVRTLVLEDAEDFGVAVPDLIYIATSFYFGEEVAKRAYATARRRRR